MSKLPHEYTPIFLYESDDSTQLTFLQVRKGVSDFLANGKYPIRVDITRSYPSNAHGMPLTEEEKALGAFEDAITSALEHNNLSVLAYYLTGRGRRLWSFYTRNLQAFGNALNAATASLAHYPIEIYAEEDREQEALEEVLRL